MFSKTGRILLVMVLVLAEGTLICLCLLFQVTIWTLSSIPSRFMLSIFHATDRISENKWLVSGRLFDLEKLFPASGRVTAGYRECRVGAVIDGSVLTQGKAEERIFTYENGQQVWW